MAGQAEAVSLWVAVYVLPVTFEVRVRVRVWSSVAALTPSAFATHCSPITFSEDELPSPIESLPPLTVQASSPSTKPSGVTLASNVSPSLSPLATVFVAGLPPFERISTFGMATCARATCPSERWNCVRAARTEMTFPSDFSSTVKVWVGPGCRVSASSCVQLTSAS